MIIRLTKMKRIQTDPDPQHCHALTSLFSKYKLSRWKKLFCKIVDGLSFFILFQFSHDDLLFSCMPTASTIIETWIYKVHTPKMTDLGKGVEVGEHYPLQYLDI